MTLKVDMKSLKREIVKLNKTGILEENVDASGETKDIVEKFCDAVEQALEKDGETLKKSRSIVETYNDLVDQLDKMTKEPEVKVEKKTKAPKTAKGKKDKPTLATTGGGKKKAEKVEKKEKEVKEKAPKKEKEVKEKAPKKEKEAKAPGVILSILEIIQKAKKGVTKDEIAKEMEKRFPDRPLESMVKTINAQIGGKKLPTRMETERKVTFVVKDGKYSVK